MEGRYVGIDLGVRSNHHAVVFDGARQRGKGFSFTTSKEGFEKLLKRATEDFDGPVHFVFEPTGLSWVPLGAHLKGKGHRAYRVKPQKASDLRKFLHKHTKSDQIDAASLARLPQIDPVGVHEMVIPSPDQMTLRRLVSRRDRITREVGKAKKRLQALLTMVNPFFMAALGGAGLGTASLNFLERYADPEKAVRLGEKRLSKLWARWSRKNAAADRVTKVLQACQRTAELYKESRRTGQLPFDYEAIQEELADEIRCLKQAQTEANRLEKKIVALHNRLDPGRTLEQLRGVGPIIAAGIDSIVIDIERFANARRFASFCGLCPRKKQSGQSDPSMPITKSGHRLLKMYLYLAAEHARLLDPDFAAYYARRYERGDHHKRIMVALAHKLALRVFALLRRRARSAANGTDEPVTYQLRNADGVELTQVQARELIAQRYLRAVVAPERHRLDKARRQVSDGGAEAGQQVAARRRHRQVDGTSADSISSTTSAAK